MTYTKIKKDIVRFFKELLMIFVKEEIMFNVNHVSISVTDMKKSIEFYKQFGFED